MGCAVEGGVSVVLRGLCAKPSRYLDDGLQITGMVRVEHLTWSTKQMDAFD